MREMKKTTVKWAPEIPVNWEVKKVKHGFYRKKAEAHQEDPVILSLARAGVKIRDINNNEGQIAESYYNYNPVAIDDLLLNPMDLYSGANCSISKVEGVISPAYINLRYKDGYNPRYYDYCFKMQYWLMYMFAYGKGVSFDNRWTLNNETLMNMPLLVPPYEEQKAIADYLDIKCEAIDVAIEEARNSIAEIQELKQNTIDGCLEAVGNTIKIKYVSDLNGRIGFRGYTTEDLVDEGEGAITLSPSNLKDLKMDYSKKTYISWFKYEESPEIQVQKDNILFVKTGSSYGKSAIVDFLPEKATINPQLIVFKPYRINPLFFLIALNSRMVGKQIEGIVTGGTIPTMSQEKIMNFIIPYTEEINQNEIAQSVISKLQSYDQLIKEKEAIISDLEKYKHALIYECVTGKRSV